MSFRSKNNSQSNGNTNNSKFENNEVNIHFNNIEINSVSNNEDYLVPEIDESLATLQEKDDNFDPHNFQSYYPNHIQIVGDHNFANDYNVIYPQPILNKLSNRDRFKKQNETQENKQSVKNYSGSFRLANNNSTNTLRKVELNNMPKVVIADPPNWRAEKFQNIEESKNVKEDSQILQKQKESEIKNDDEKKLPEIKQTEIKSNDIISQNGKEIKKSSSAISEKKNIIIESNEQRKILTDPNKKDKKKLKACCIIF